MEDSRAQNEEEVEQADGKVADALSEAAKASDPYSRVDNLRKVRDLILRDSALLDNFLDEMVAFKSDKSPEVRKFLAEFIEDATKVDLNLLTTFLPLVALFLGDNSSCVVKRAILCHAQLYKITLKWIAGMRGHVEEQTRIIWNTVVTMKDQIFRLLESTNQGVRSHVIKFMEHIALALSHKTPESEPCRSTDIDISLDSISEKHSYLRYSDLKLEGSKIIQVFLTLITSPQVTCSNLQVAINCLVSIARQRPVYMAPVIQSFESVHVNLPPTLAKSQVASVRKNLKLQLSAIVKHPAIPPYISQITTLLADLGATSSEINKMIPRNIRDAAAKLRKEREEQQLIKPTTKKARLEEEASSSVQLEQNKRTAAIDVTTDHLIPRLKRPETVANIVLLSMLNLPDYLPAHFQSTYTPIDSAGTQAQIEHLARLMATQMTAVGVGPGVEMIAKEESKQAEAKKAAAVEAEAKAASLSSVSTKIHHVNPAAGKDDSDFRALTKSDKTVTDTKQTLFTPETLAANLQMRDPSKRSVKPFNFREAAGPPMSSESLDMYAKSCLKRIMFAEKKIAQCGASKDRINILTNLAVNHEEAFEHDLENFISDDLKSRYDLMMAWLFRLYSKIQHTQPGTPANKNAIRQYEKLLLNLLRKVLETPEYKEVFLSRVFIEAPLLTNQVFSTLSRYCTLDDSVHLCIATLSDVITKRPSHMQTAVNYLLLLTTLDQHKARTEALKFIIQLYTSASDDSFKEMIEDFATKKMESVMESMPPDDIVNKQGKPYNNWTDEAIKQCLFLYLGLLPLNHSLLHRLVNNYSQCSADVKRTLLRIMEAPVRSMGQESEAIHKVVEACPEGCETLLIRILHVLTEKEPPSEHLVSTVRTMYKDSEKSEEDGGSPPDVRFLIPILGGLEKQEILDALPKLIRLSPELVKEVLKRLLGSGMQEQMQPPNISANDVLVGLHQLEGVDLKPAMAAVNMCMAEDTIFNQSVIAVALSNMLELPTLPTLIMRTVLQSLSRHPRLRNFVLSTVLQRLIVRQVWKLPKLWEGFIRCVQKTQPESFHILLQLPTDQVTSIFEAAADLKAGLVKHWNSLPAYQKSQVLPSLQQLLNDNAAEPQTPQPTPAPPHRSSSSRRERGSGSRSSHSRPPPVDEHALVSHVKPAKQPEVKDDPDAPFTDTDRNRIIEQECSNLFSEMVFDLANEIASQMHHAYNIQNKQAEFALEDLVTDILNDECFSVGVEAMTEMEIEESRRRSAAESSPPPPDLPDIDEPPAKKTKEDDA